MASATQELEIEPGKLAWGGYEEVDRIITWPTELYEKTIVTKLVDMLDRDGEKRDWRRQIVANLSWLTVKQFMASDETYLQNNSGLVRFNAGRFPNGFSVTAIIEDGQTELQGIFPGTGYEELAKSVIGETIIESGRPRIDEIIELGRISIAES